MNEKENKINYRVRSVTWPRSISPCKKLHLENLSFESEYNNEKTNREWLNVPRSASVSVGDEIKLSNDGALCVISCKNGTAKILPFYQVDEKFNVGQSSYEITIKEIITAEEKNGYDTLTQHHYRNKALFGRHAALIAQTTNPLLPNVIGYIELSTPFFLNAPRRNLLDAPIVLNGVSWQAWNANTAKNLIHLFVRIARCVVHPELRSSGLGKLLIYHAAEFAKMHWQVVGWKPYFIEISADMLRYIPFAEKSGMVYIGETEGNLHRISKDLDYFSSNLKRIKNKELFSGNPSGILDSKLLKFNRALKNLDSQEGNKISEIVERQLKNPTLKGWSQLKDILSLPKPYFIMGLNVEASRMIEKRIKILNLPNSPAKNTKDFVKEAYNSRLLSPIEIKDVHYEIPIKVRRTKVTNIIERAFEISLN